MVIVGIDEVGRGCLAGPLVAGAVILGRPVRGLKDSKLLTREQREKLNAKILSRALAVGLGWVEPAYIDEFGLTAANRLAMELALAQIEIDYDQIIIDGRLNFLAGEPKAKAVIKADLTVPVVSAASIVAKVARDNYMAGMAVKYPKYGFESHVGYGTKLHLERLKLHGVSDLHRLSYQPVRALL
jgi:ribonuclease HII